MSRLPDASPHNRAEFQAQREIGRKASADLLADQQAEARAYACPECSAERAAHADPPAVLPVLRQAEAAITALLARPERQPSGAALYPLWVMIDGREIAALETALAALRKITGGQS